MSTRFASSGTAPSLAAAWFTLALAALGLSAVFAVVLVVARTPFLGQGATLFRTALVLHVDLAVQVWFLAMAAGIWSLRVATTNPLRWVAFALAAAGTLAMVCTPLLGGAIPVLANYVPLLDHPVFLYGLGLLAAGTGLMALAALTGRRREIVAPWHMAANFAALALFATIVVLLLDLLGTPAATLAAVGIDDRLWGIGHSIQFVHVLLLMGAWCALGADAIARVATLPRALPWIFCLALLPALGAPAITILHPVGSVEYRHLFTELMRWGAWPAAALLGLGLVAGLLRVRRERKLSAEEMGLGLSLVLFSVGCLLGTSIRGESLAVPAHYHGTVGAVTLAYLLWLRSLARDMGVAPARLAKTGRLALIYGLGILVLVSGLAVAGYLGVPRKATHAQLGAETGAYLAAMGVAGVGGFIALSAVATLAAFGLRAAWLTRYPRGLGMLAYRRDIRVWALVVTLLLVITGGWFLDLLPRSGPLAFSPEQHAKQKIRADIELRFQQGVVMLHAKQYDHALMAFHRVLQLAPEMPEAYVNTGFALFGMKRYKEARDFFESATLLRSKQVNAYYGLAVAAEAMGDMESALGAMQTFVHLSKVDDPFRRKAESALWEWRAVQTGRRQMDGPASLTQRSP